MATKPFCSLLTPEIKQPVQDKVCTSNLDDDEEVTKSVFVAVEHVELENMMTNPEPDAPMTDVSGLFQVQRKEDGTTVSFIVLILSLLDTLDDEMAGPPVDEVAAQEAEIVPGQWVAAKVSVLGKKKIQQEVFFVKALRVEDTEAEVHFLKKAPAHEYYVMDSSASTVSCVDIRDLSVVPTPTTNLGGRERFYFNV
ncbi:hypothetical protein GJAV_G00114130 [Gymnothorax javanicus]|nr:hypothetical protein GJAV_G00114130 [Gymnothorax javanicus]